MLIDLTLYMCVDLDLTLFNFQWKFNHFPAAGNHESINMNQMYGFEGEVRAKYSQQMWDLFTEIFNWLPLAHLLQSRVLVTHGGLFSRDGVKVSELVDIDRNRQPPEEGWYSTVLRPLRRKVGTPSTANSGPLMIACPCISGSH